MKEILGLEAPMELTSNLALDFNLLEFPLFPNGPNWFPLIKLILISNDNPIGLPNYITFIESINVNN